MLHMSHLSQAEATAGISRSAIAAIRGRNGHRKNGADKLAESNSSDTSDTSQKPHPAPPPELTQVLRTWCRALDIVNIDGWHFKIRDTVHLSDVPHSSTLQLDRPAMDALLSALTRVLQESGPRSEL
jgi:hypothetical protein